MSLPKKAWRLSSCCFSCFCAACVGAVGLGLWLREGSGLYGVSLLSSATWSVDAGCALVACAVAISLLKPRPGEIAMVRGATAGLRSSLIPAKSMSKSESLYAIGHGLSNIEDEESLAALFSNSALNAPTCETGASLKLAELERPGVSGVSHCWTGSASGSGST